MMDRHHEIDRPAKEKRAMSEFDPEDPQTVRQMMEKLGWCLEISDDDLSVVWFKTKGRHVVASQGDHAWHEDLEQCTAAVFNPLQPASS